MNNYDYPIGSDTPEAPWNQEEPEMKEVEVDIEVTLKKRVKLNVNDYKIVDIYDEGNNGDHWFSYPDFTNCDLHKAVIDQIDLPKKDGWEMENLEIDNND